MKRQLDVKLLNEMTEEELSKDGYFSLDITYDGTAKQSKLSIQGEQIPAAIVLEGLVKAMSELLVDVEIKDTEDVLQTLLALVMLKKAERETE